MKKKFLLIALAGLLIAMVACAGPLTPTPALQEVTASPSLEPDGENLFPTGLFTSGEWTWEFKADGTFFNSGPLGSETGTWRTDGEKVIIICQCCGDVEGAYTWALVEETLSFQLVEDDCSNRSDVVNGSEWIRQP